MKGVITGRYAAGQQWPQGPYQGCQRQRTGYASQWLPVAAHSGVLFGLGVHRFKNIDAVGQAGGGAQQRGARRHDSVCVCDRFHVRQRLKG